MEKKYVVPEGMKQGVRSVVAARFGPMAIADAEIDFIAEAVLKYQAEHPPVPNERQLSALNHVCNAEYEELSAAAQTWDRIKYLAPEPEIPECLKPLMAATHGLAMGSGKQHDEAVLKAYELGLRAGRQG